jgi:thiamine biosynthesis protein ThiS
MKAEQVLITANGTPVRLDAACSIAEFLTARGLKATQVVVEHNGRVVPRHEFESVLLNRGDRLEVIVPVAGG